MARILTGATALLAFLAVPAAAEPAGEAAKRAQAEERATNSALLAALLKRRAELIEAGGAKSNSAALEFLDKRIAQLKSRIGS